MAPHMINQFFVLAHRVSSELIGLLMRFNVIICRFLVIFSESLSHLQLYGYRRCLAVQSHLIKFMFSTLTSRVLPLILNLLYQPVSTFNYIIKLQVLFFLLRFPGHVRRIVDTFGEKVLLLNVFTNLLLEKEEHSPNKLNFDALAVDWTEDL